MKAKALEILIAMGILFGLVLLTFVVGCKDEAEAIEPRIHWDEDTEGITITDSNFVMPEPNDYVTSAKNEQSIVEFVCPCGWKYTVMGYNLSYRKSFSIVMGITEPNEPTYSPIYDRALSAKEIAEINQRITPEPNEPKLTFTRKELDEIYKDVLALGKLAKALYGFTEPNEPECKHEVTINCAVGGCNDCLKCIDCGKDLFQR